MNHARILSTLGVALALAVPAVGESQLTRGSASPPRMGGATRAPAIRREPSLPPITMGSLPQYSAPAVHGDSYYGSGISYGAGRRYPTCYYCGAVVAYAPYIINSFNSVNSHNSVHVHTSYVGWPRWSRWYAPLPYAYPVYTTFWAPNPVKVWAPTADAQPRAGLTAATARADADAALRVDTPIDGVARVIWLGTVRPVREARVFLADSLQQSLRAARVDKDTPSALLELREIAARVAYVGLTITHENGLIETTLVPYRRGEKSNP